MRPVRSLALYGFLGSGNVGNDASMEAIRDWLRRHRPELDLSCITIAPDEVQTRYGLPAVALSASGLWSGGGPVRSTLGKVLGRVADVPRALRLAGSADAVLVPGMGVLEEELGVRPWGLPAWLCLTAAACRLRRRPFILLGIGAEPVQSPATRRLFAWTVRLAAHTSCRDQRSARAVRGFGAPQPDVVIPDVAFLHGCRSHTAPRPGRLVVGVMAYYGRRDDPVRGREVRNRYVRALAEALAGWTDGGNHVVLVGGDRADSDVIHEVRARLLALRPDLPAHRVSGREVTTFAQLTDEMAAAEVVVASRFHNLICGLRLNRPIVSIGYAQKHSDLMTELGLESFRQSIEDLDAGLLLAQVQQAQTDQEALSESIRRAVAPYPGRVSSVLANVLADLGSGRATVAVR